VPFVMARALSDSSDTVLGEAISPGRQVHAVSKRASHAVAIPRHRDLPTLENLAAGGAASSLGGGRTAASRRPQRIGLERGGGAAVRAWLEAETAGS